MPTVTARMECVPKWFFVLDMPVFANMQIIDRASGICIKSSSRNSKTFSGHFQNTWRMTRNVWVFVIGKVSILCYQHPPFKLVWASSKQQIHLLLSREKRSPIYFLRQVWSPSISKYFLLIPHPLLTFRFTLQRFSSTKIKVSPAS